MKKPRLLVLTLISLSSLVCHAAETMNDSLTVPSGTKAISSPLNLGGNKPGPLAFYEKGGVYVLPALPLAAPDTAKISHVGSDGGNSGYIKSPGSTTGLFSSGGSIYLGGNANFKLSGGGVDKVKIFAKCGVSDSTAIAFALGLDGRIYGTFSDSGMSITATDGSKAESMNSGAVFRFEPDGTHFEIVHRGLINPSGIAFNEYGDAYVIDAPAGTGDKARLIRLVEDGDSGWNNSCRKQEPAETRWMTEKMWETRTDSQPAFSLPASAHLTTSPAGLAYHPGTGFLENETGRFFVCDDTGDTASSGVVSFGIKETRGGVRVIDPRLIVSGVKSSGIAFATDGNFFFTDIEGRNFTFLDHEKNMHLPEKNSQAATLLSEGFDQRSSEELAALLGHPNSRVRLHAQISLTRKSDAIEVFKKSLESTELLARIHAIHGLGIIARRGSSPTPGEEFTTLPAKGIRETATSLLSPLLADPNPEIRVQALRAIVDAPLPGDSISLGTLLLDDSDRVRFAAAIAIGKLKALGQYSAVINFLAKNNSRDPYLSHAGSYALQHMVDTEPQISALTVYDSPAVRLAAVVALRRMGSLEVVRFLNDTDPAVQDEVIRTVIDLNLKEAFPMLTELLENSTREWPPVILSMLETAKRGTH
ncbi:MAG: hypothetical protein NWR51_04845 [Akkermansiaceae bacterium]|nr:hypothetical protein [Akkermansiaceae bacterium]